MEPSGHTVQTVQQVKVGSAKDLVAGEKLSPVETAATRGTEAMVSQVGTACRAGSLFCRQWSVQSQRQWMLAVGHQVTAGKAVKQEYRGVAVQEEPAVPGLVGARAADPVVETDCLATGGETGRTESREHRGSIDST